VKNFKKCINSNNLATRYNADADFALHARMIPALAFVALQDLEASFQELSDNSPPELQPVLDWMEDNYISRPIDGSHLPTGTGAVVHLSFHMRCGPFMIESYNIWIALTTTPKPPTGASKPNSR